MTNTIPQALNTLIGKPQYPEQSDIDINLVAIRDGCAAVQNDNPMYWDREYCLQHAGRQVAPSSQLSTWLRPHHWRPGNEKKAQALQAHFDVKQLLGLPEAIITGNELEFGMPVCEGDRLHSYQVLESISEVKRNRLGVGRYWVVAVIFENQRGEFVGRDRYTAFGYSKEGAVNA